MHGAKGKKKWAKQFRLIDEVLICGTSFSLNGCNDDILGSIDSISRGVVNNNILCHVMDLCITCILNINSFFYTAIQLYTPIQTFVTNIFIQCL